MDRPRPGFHPLPAALWSTNQNGAYGQAGGQAAQQPHQQFQPMYQQTPQIRQHIPQVYPMVNSSNQQQQPQQQFYNRQQVPQTGGNINQQQQHFQRQQAEQAEMERRKRFETERSRARMMMQKGMSGQQPLNPETMIANIIGPLPTPKPAPKPKPTVSQAPPQSNPALTTQTTPSMPSVPMQQPSEPVVKKPADISGIMMQCADLSGTKPKAFQKTGLSEMAKNSSPTHHQSSTLAVNNNINRIAPPAPAVYQKAGADLDGLFVMRPPQPSATAASNPPNSCHSQQQSVRPPSHQPSSMNPQGMSHPPAGMVQNPRNLHRPGQPQPQTIGSVVEGPSTTTPAAAAATPPPSSSLLDMSRIPQEYMDLLGKCGGSAKQYPDTSIVYNLLVSSGLGRETLGAVWSMANRTIPCTLTQQEFFFAIILTAQVQNGNGLTLNGLIGNQKSDSKYPVPKLGFPPQQFLSSSPASSSAQPQTTINNNDNNGASHSTTLRNDIDQQQLQQNHDGKISKESFSSASSTTATRQPPTSASQQTVIEPFAAFQEAPLPTTTPTNTADPPLSAIISSGSSTTTPAAPSTIIPSIPPTTTFNRPLTPTKLDSSSDDFGDFQEATEQQQPIVVNGNINPPSSVQLNPPPLPPAAANGEDSFSAIRGLDALESTTATDSSNPASKDSIHSVEEGEGSSTTRIPDPFFIAPSSAKTTTDDNNDSPKTSSSNSNSNPMTMNDDWLSDMPHSATISNTSSIPPSSGVNTPATIPSSKQSSPVHQQQQTNQTSNNPLSNLTTMPGVGLMSSSTIGGGTTGSMMMKPTSHLAQKYDALKGIDFSGDLHPAIGSLKQHHANNNNNNNTLTDLGELMDNNGPGGFSQRSGTPDIGTPADLADSLSIRSGSHEPSVHSLDLKQPPVSSNGATAFPSAIDGEIMTDFPSNGTGFATGTEPNGIMSSITMNPPPIDLTDKYAAFRGELSAAAVHIPSKGPDDSLRVWKECLGSAKSLLGNSERLLGSASTSAVCNEVVNCEAGRTYLRCIGEVYKVVTRIRITLKTTTFQPESLVDILAELQEIWNSILTFSSGASSSILPKPADLDFSDSILTKDSTMSSVCGLCLLHVKEKSLTNYGGRTYHGHCANFWLNNVDSLLPSLPLPSLF